MTPESSVSRVWRVPDGHRVYAIGDIHGRRDLLAILHEHILADSANGKNIQKTIIYLGDYIDRGDDSAGVIDFLLGQMLPGFARVHLKGNHEEMLLMFLDDVSVGEVWLWNGGDATMRSYGLDVPEYNQLSVQSLDALAAWQRELADRIPPAHLDFLRRLRLHHTAGAYLFVHAGIRPGVPLAAQNARDLMWIREPFLSSTVEHGLLVVHGHTIFPSVSITPNRIGIDTGAVATDCLSCLVLEGHDRRLLHTLDHRREAIKPVSHRGRFL
jgi:serine/threonine protein phosphatase 1